MSRHPEALLLIAPGCSHCPTMLEHLSKLVKTGGLGRLEVVNISQMPAVAEKFGVRSVPWCRIDSYEFSGLVSYSELSGFIEQLNDGGGNTAYLVHLLQNRQMDRAAMHIKRDPVQLVDLIPLLGALEEPMALRIGIGALIEELSETPALAYALAPLQYLARSDEPQVRADACHYLGLCGDPAATPDVRMLLDDEDPVVREIAAETLALLHEQD